MEGQLFDRLYAAAPDGYGGVRLTLRQPIRTTDSKDSLLFGRERRVRSQDEILESQNSGKVIGLGKVWTGAGVNPQLDEKVAPIRDFVSGFVPGNIVHAESPGKVISLGRVYLPELQDEERREALTRALDEAEEEWKKDKRSNSEKPPATTDSVSRRPALFSAARTTDYAASLKKGRETQALSPPSRVVTAKDYAANLAAGRAAKG